MSSHDAGCAKTRTVMIGSRDQLAREVGLMLGSRPSIGQCPEWLHPFHVVGQDVQRHFGADVAHKRANRNGRESASGLFDPARNKGRRKGRRGVYWGIWPLYARVGQRITWTLGFVSWTRTTRAPPLRERYSGRRRSGGRRLVAKCVSSWLENRRSDAHIRRVATIAQCNQELEVR